LDVRGRPGGAGAVAHECAQRLKNWLTILLGGVHHGLKREDAAEPDPDIVAAELLEAF
jgi:hypothetical protein